MNLKPLQEKSRMRITLLCGLLVLLGSTLAHAEKPAPLKALLITGGCCHDYEKQKHVLSEGVSARAHVEWTIVHEGGNSSNHRMSIHADKDWASGYDVIVHNECFSGVTDLDFIRTITDAHKAGVPGVVIHCAMHSYRGQTDQWFKFCGVRSHRHGPQLPIEVALVQAEHPIVRGLPSSWTSVPTELYLISELYDSTTPLATGVQRNDPDNSHTCIWIGQFGEGRVFGTTLGHHTKEFEEPSFLDFVTRGLLWSCGKLGDDGKPLAGYEGTGVKVVPKQPEPQPTLAVPESR
jgi:uncharacterized protein